MSDDSRCGMFRGIVKGYDSSTGIASVVLPEVYGKVIVLLPPLVPSRAAIPNIVAVNPGDSVMVFFSGAKDALPYWVPTVIDGSEFAPVGHNHDSEYAAIDHDHDDVYSLLGHTHTYLPLAGGTLTGELLLPDGTAGSPSLALSDDANTGLYSPAADKLGLSTGGTSRAVLDSAGLSLSGAIMAAAARSDAAMTVAKVDGTAVDGAIYAMRTASAALGSDTAVPYAVAGSETTLLTLNITTERANAVVVAIANVEYSVTAAGTGIAVYGCKFDDAASAHNIDVHDANTTTRDNRARAWIGTFATAGSHTVKLACRKTVNDGTVTAFATNTVLLALIFE